MAFRNPQMPPSEVSELLPFREGYCLPTGLGRASGWSGIYFSRLRGSGFSRPGGTNTHQGAIPEPRQQGLSLAGGQSSRLWMASSGGSCLAEARQEAHPQKSFLRAEWNFYRTPSLRADWSPVSRGSQPLASKHVPREYTKTFCMS